LNRRLAALLALHGAWTWAMFGSGSAWATTPLECQTGGMAALLRAGSPWSVADLWHGAMGAHFLVALLSVPLHAVMDPAVANQVLAWAGAAGLVAIVWTLLERHLGWEAALCGAAAVAFGPPVLARAAWSLGDWHWSQMLFDFGALALALHARRRWALLGAVTGLGLANSLGSLPYLALAWAVAAWRGLDRGAAVGAGLAAVLAWPAWWKLLVHRPFGLPPTPDRTASRLSSFGFEPDKLLDLLGPPFAQALHLPAGGAWLWMAAVWGGALVLAAAVIRGLRPPIGARLRWRRAPSLPAMLLVWLGVFVAAYVVLRVRLLVGPEDFSNARSTTHRLLPPLVASLAVAAGAGWGGLARRRRAFLAVGLLPALLGAGAQIALLGDGSLRDFRGVCFEPLGYYAGQTIPDPAAALAACDELPVGAPGCRVGAAWGVGFGAAASANDRFLRDRRGRSVLTMGAEADSAAVCRTLPADLRGGCLRGFGWHGGAFNWVARGWPVQACAQLRTDEERRGCWAGVGFPLGDHLGPTPERIGRVLLRADPAVRPDIARGAGYAIGRTWGRPGRALRLCDRIGEHADACRRGVEEAFAERQR
jgi:hypothetical protein